MKELANTLQNLKFEDLRPYAQEITLHGDDLLIVERLGDVDLSQVAIRTSFFTIAVCTKGFAHFVLNGKECHVKEGELFITKIFVDGGATLKRMRPAPQGRGYRIRKRSNHVTVFVGTKEETND